MIKFIHDNQIGRLIFLAGDVHISHFVELAPKDPQRPKRYQFTSSPLAKSTKWNALHERIALRDQIPLYQKTYSRIFKDCGVGIVSVEPLENNYLPTLMAPAIYL